MTGVFTLTDKNISKFVHSLQTLDELITKLNIEDPFSRGSVQYSLEYFEELVQSYKIFLLTSNKNNVYSSFDSSSLFEVEIKNEMVQDLMNALHTLVTKKENALPIEPLSKDSIEFLCADLVEKIHAIYKHFYLNSNSLHVVPSGDDLACYDYEEDDELAVLQEIPKNKSELPVRSFVVQNLTKNDDSSFIVLEHQLQFKKV